MSNGVIEMKNEREDKQPTGDTAELVHCLDIYCANWIRDRLMMENLCLSDESLKYTAERYSAEIIFMIMTSLNNMIEDDLSNVRKLRGQDRTDL